MSTKFCGAIPIHRKLKCEQYDKKRNARRESIVFGEKIVEIKAFFEAEKKMIFSGTNELCTSQEAKKREALLLQCLSV